SGGELENDERMANIMYGLISSADKVDQLDEKNVKLEENVKSFKRISVMYEDYCYSICLSNKKVHIVKRKLVLNPVEPVMA
ncbi:hypothetical protein L9F63_000618, partial [Diploptera punctata]